MTFAVLCFILLLLNLTQNKSISTNLELNSNPKKLKLPLEQDELPIKNRLKLIENIVTLDSSVKGTDLINSNQQFTLITIFITVNNKCPTDNCFDCYAKKEINYPELSDKEAFDKIFKEMDLNNTLVKGIYFNPKMTKEYKNPIYSAWNKYKRKMIPIRGISNIDKYIPKKYNNEYLQALIQGYEFTIIDHIYEKNNKNYKYNNLTLQFDEIKIYIKCQRRGDDINYPELNDQEAFDKVFKEMELCDAFVKNIYWKISLKEMWDSDDYIDRIKRYQRAHLFFVWNNYKRKMIPLKVIGYIYENTNNEYLQSAVQGYKFTFMDHLYEKDKKYYKYNDNTKKFDEIKFDSV